MGIKQNQLAIGIGIIGLADLFLKLKYSFDQKEARELNIKIHETIYYGALEASCELAAKYGYYKTYLNSPASNGVSLLKPIIYNFFTINMAFLM